MPASSGVKNIFHGDESGFMNRKVYLIAVLMAALAAALINFKMFYGNRTVSFAPSQHLWRVNIIINAKGKGTRAKVRLTLPQRTERQVIYNEHFENDELALSVLDRPETGNRMAYWRSELLEGARIIQYFFSVQLKSRQFAVSQNDRISKEPLTRYPQGFERWLNPSPHIQSKAPEIKKQLRKIIGKEKRVDLVTRKIYDYVRGEVQYRSEKGSKDAAETMKQMVADCGGHARLFVALCRAAGIPSRMVGGLLMNESVKNITHVWVENYIGEQWIPFDTTNNHYAYLPNRYLVLYHDDVALIGHSGLSKIDYFFSITRERMPPVDNPWSLYVLPIHFQSSMKFLLLIPVGALVVAFFRAVIGVPTFGTFAPVLLALAFRHISLGVGFLCLGILIFVGWVFRKVLDSLKILVIPRLSLIVTMVIVLILAMNILAFNLGQQKILYISLFPMIIITWTIERFSVIQIEDGTKAAFKTFLGTLVVSTAAYYVMGIRPLHAYLFAFPEILLVVMALMLLLGRYTGVRLSELWRFREFRKVNRKPDV